MPLPAKPVVVPGRVTLRGRTNLGEPREVSITTWEFALELARLYTTGPDPWQEWSVWDEDVNDGGCSKCISASSDTERRLPQAA